MYSSGITGTQYINTVVTPGTAYTYSVKAKNASAAQTTNSNGTLSGTAVTCAPGTFTITATATCSGTTSAINLTWTASANATSYDVYRNGNLYAPDLTTTSFLNTYLITAGTTYTYYIKAKNSAGTINNSNGTLSVKAISCSREGEAGTEELSVTDVQFTVFPNPSDGEITIALSNHSTSVMDVLIADLSGKTIFEKTVKTARQEHSETLNISTLPKGIYLMRITTGNKEFTRKIIKN